MEGQNDERFRCGISLHRECVQAIRLPVKGLAALQRRFHLSELCHNKKLAGIFEIRIPDHIEIIPQPDIIPFEEHLSSAEAYALLKESSDGDYLDYGYNEETKKWDVYIGENSKYPIDSLSTEEEAQ